MWLLIVAEDVEGPVVLRPPAQHLASIAVDAAGASARGERVTA